MTEYDYSPAAYEKYMQTQVRVSNWVEGQKYHLPYYRHPVVDTKPPSKTSRSTTTSSTPPSTAKDQSAPKQSNTVHRRSNTTRTGSKTTARRPGVQARSNSVPSRRDHRKSVSPEPPAKLRRSSNQQNPVRKDIPQSRNSSTRDGHPGRSYTTTSPNRPVLMNNGLLVFLQNGSYAHYRVPGPLAQVMKPVRPHSQGKQEPTLFKRIFSGLFTNSSRSSSRRRRSSF